MDLYGAALGRFLYPAWERLRGRPTFELLAQLQRTERASLDELIALRTGYLRRLVRHAYHRTDHYRRAFDAIGLLPDDIVTLEDLTAVPILAQVVRGPRATLSRTPPPLVDSPVKPPLEEGVWRGGSETITPAQTPAAEPASTEDSCRTYAAQALGRIGNAATSALPELREVARTGPESLRPIAAQAIRLIEAS